MMLPKTLRARFALWVSGLLLVVLAAFAAFVYFSLSQSLASLIDDSLVLSARQASTAVHAEGGAITLSDTQPEGRDATEDLRERGLTIRILGPADKVVTASGAFRKLSPPPDVVAAAWRGQPSFATVLEPTEEDPVRFYAAPIAEDGRVVGVVQAAQSLGPVVDTREALFTALAIAIPVLVLIAGLAGYNLTGRALAPIDQMTRTAQRISAENLSARLELPASDDELGRLAATFNAMLDRLDDAFQRERQFTDDASHELRTPLAAMQVILGVIRQQRRSPEDYERALTDLSEEADRLRALVDNLLQLARSEGQGAATRRPIDLSALLVDVTESLAPLAEAKGLAIESIVPPGLWVVGDGDDLIRLFINLVDNAIRYSDHGYVRVIAVGHDDGIAVTVSDTGRGIAPEHLPRIFNRFYRADSSRTAGGAGLGLAIAWHIAHQHGGTLTAQSSLGAGSNFVTVLPRSAHRAHSQPLPGDSERTTP